MQKCAHGRYLYNPRQFPKVKCSRGIYITNKHQRFEPDPETARPPPHNPQTMLRGDSGQMGRGDHLMKLSSGDPDSQELRQSSNLKGKTRCILAAGRGSLSLPTGGRIVPATTAWSPASSRSVLMLPTVIFKERMKEFACPDRPPASFRP